MVITPRLRFCLYEGVPDNLRGLTWGICSGSIYKYQAKVGYYASMLLHASSVTHSDVFDEIEKVEK
jgi:hypothetical protein